MSSSGGTGPASSAPGAFPVTGLLSPDGGVDTAAHGAFSSPGIATGVAFTPSATDDCVVQVTAEATTAGTFGVSYGPVNGTEHQWLPVTNLLAGSGLPSTLWVPTGWKVVATTTGVTVSLTTSVHAL